MLMLYNLGLILVIGLLNMNFINEQVDVNVVDTREVLELGTYVSDMVQILEPNYADGEVLEIESSQDYDYTIVRQDDEGAPTLCLEIEGSIWVFHTCNIPDGNMCEYYGPICDWIEL